jgi:hypothetical protein
MAALRGFKSPLPPPSPSSPPLLFPPPKDHRGCARGLLGSMVSHPMGFYLFIFRFPQSISLKMFQIGGELSYFSKLYYQVAVSSREMPCPFRASLFL